MIDFSELRAYETREFSERLAVLGEKDCTDLNDLGLMREGTAEDALYGTHFKIDYNICAHNESFLCVRHGVYLSWEACRFYKRRAGQYPACLSGGFQSPTEINASATQCSTGALLRMLRHGGSQPRK